MTYNLAFWGTPRISATFLEKIISTSSLQIQCVITQPDKPRSKRGKHLLCSPVKEVALKHNLVVCTPNILKNNLTFLKEIQLLNIDLHIVFAYGKIIPSFILNSSNFHAINFHASLLPTLRGPSPIEYALLQNLHQTGWTLQKITHELDAGDIIKQIIINISNEDTQETLTHKLMEVLYKEGTTLILNYLNNKYLLKKQDNTKVTYSKKHKKQDGLIHWEKLSDQVRNQYRAYCIAPSVFSYFQKKRIKLYFNLQKEALQVNSKHKIGSIFAINDYIWVVCGDYCALPIEFVQIEGKPKIHIKDFINGYHIKPYQNIFSNSI